MICINMAGQYPRILNILKINRKIYNISKLKYPVNNYPVNNNYSKNSFTTKYLINKYNYKHKETVLKNRSLILK